MRLYFGGLTRRGSDEWEWQGIVAASDARAAKALLRRSCKGLVPCIMPSGGPRVEVDEGAYDSRDFAFVAAGEVLPMTAGDFDEVCESSRGPRR